MRNLTPKGFLNALMLIFFGGVAMDVSRMLLGFDAGIARPVIFATSAGLLSLLLYDRLTQLHQSRVWAGLGLVPPLGLAFGLYLYVSAPKSDGRQVEGG